MRSPHAHARITGIDVSDALDVDGLVGVYTWDDLPGRLADPLLLLIPHPDLTHPRTQYALARGEVNHVGEAVAMVVAVDRYVAEDAADRIVVDYEPCPRWWAWTRPGPATGWSTRTPGNVAAVTTQELGDAAAAIAAAPHVLELDLAMERSLSSPLEGRACMPAGTTRTAGCACARRPRPRPGCGPRWPTSSACPTWPSTSSPRRRRRLRHQGRPPTPEEVLVPWAARLLGREVKWVEDRYEHFVSATHERGQQHHVRVGFDDDGTILGLEVDFWHDTGPTRPYGIVLPIITATQLPGPYRHRNYRVTFTSLYTNTVTVTPYRGAGGRRAAS